MTAVVQRSMSIGMLTPKRVAQIARPIAQSLDIAELYLFGSVANGSAREDSDLDFIYAAPKDGDALKVRDLKRRLCDAFGRDVDLVSSEYVSEPIENDPLAEMQRRLFVDSLNRHPLYRIV